MNRKMLAAVGLSGVLSCALLNAAECSSSASSAPSTPNWFMQTIHGTLPERFTLRLHNEAGEEIKCTHFKPSKTDPYAKKPLFEIIRTTYACVLAVVKYQSKTKKSGVRSDLVEGRQWHQRLPKKHPVYDRFIVGHPRYYYVEEHGHDEFVGIFIGTERDASHANEKGELLQLMLNKKQNKDIWEDIGHSYLRQRDFESAGLWLEKALAATHENPCRRALLLFSLCTVHFKTGDFDKAVECGEKALALKVWRSDLDLVKYLFRAYEANRQWDKILDVGQKLLDHGAYADAEFLTAIGLAYEHLNDPMPAAGCYIDATEEDDYGFLLAPLMHLLYLQGQGLIDEKILTKFRRFDYRSKVKYARKFFEILAKDKRVLGYNEEELERFAVARAEAMRLLKIDIE